MIIIFFVFVNVLYLKRKEEFYIQIPKILLFRKSKEITKKNKIFHSCFHKMRCMKNQTFVKPEKKNNVSTCLYVLNSKRKKKAPFPNIHMSLKYT